MLACMLIIVGRAWEVNCRWKILAKPSVTLLFGHHCITQNLCNISSLCSAVSTALLYHRPLCLKLFVISPPMFQITSSNSFSSFIQRLLFSFTAKCGAHPKYTFMMEYICTLTYTYIEHVAMVTSCTAILNPKPSHALENCNTKADKELHVQCSFIMICPF